MSKLTHYAHPRGWIKGEPMMGNPDRPFAVTPVRIWNSDDLPTDHATILSFTTAAVRDQWLKWWGK